MSRNHIHINPRAWAQLRLHVFRRDKYRCCICGAAGRLEADHRVPLWRGGAALDPKNIQTLCRSCHRKKTGAENSRVSDEQKAWAVLVAELVKTG